MTATLKDAVAQVVAESRMSLTQFSRTAEVSRKQLERILAGEIARPHDHTLRRIAAVVDRDTEDLIAVRDEGRPLPAIGEDAETELRARVQALEDAVAEIRELLGDVRNTLTQPDA